MLISKKLMWLLGNQFRAIDSYYICERRKFSAWYIYISSCTSMNRTCENLANPQKKNLKLRRRRFLIIIKNSDLHLRSSVLKMQQHGKFLFFLPREELYWSVTRENTAINADSKTLDTKVIVNYNLGWNFQLKTFPNF